jgi:hypothetical protein
MVQLQRATLGLAGQIPGQMDQINALWAQVNDLRARVNGRRTTGQPSLLPSIRGGP